MVAWVFNPSTQMVESGGSKFQGILGCIASSRLVWIAYQDSRLCLKINLHVHGHTFIHTYTHLEQLMKHKVIG